MLEILAFPFIIIMFIGITSLTMIAGLLAITGFIIFAGISLMYDKIKMLFNNFGRC